MCFDIVREVVGAQVSARLEAAQVLQPQRAFVTRRTCITRCPRSFALRKRGPMRWPSCPTSWSMPLLINLRGKSCSRSRVSAAVRRCTSLKHSASVTH